MILNRELNEINYRIIGNEIAEIKETSKLITQRRFRKTAIKWYNIACGLDIETTSYKDENDNKHAWIYEITLGIGDHIYLMRTTEELRNVLQIIQDTLDLNDNKRIACYIHNYKFEWSFLKRELLYTDGFFADDRTPFKTTSIYGIEFRDSLILSALDLDHTAKNLHSHNTKKLKGDLDYRLIRTPETPLTKEEWQYCINDVQIILDYINEQIEEFGDITRIPLTNTGRVRNYMRDRCLYVVDNYGHKVKTDKGKYMRNREFVGRRDLETMNEDLYSFARKAFRGGFTHGNSRYCDLELSNVGSYDLTSAYPSVMVSKLFPSYSPCKFYPVNKIQFENALDLRACLFYVEFINIDINKDAPDSYISWIPIKMYGENVIANDNGRITHADKLGMYMTEIDWRIINKVYHYDNYNYSEYMYIWNKDHLPVEFIKGLLKLYKDKTELKGVVGSEVEYQRSKGMLNSLYGCEVEDPIKDPVSVEEIPKEIEDKELSEVLDLLNSKYGRFTYYPVGLWVTAYCRERIWDAIMNANWQDYRYTDTDSIKLSHPEKYKAWFDNYNKSIREEMYKAMDYYKLPRELVEPTTKKGKVKLLGEFDFEGSYNKFKYLGAKRYMTMSQYKVGKCCPLLNALGKDKDRICPVMLYKNNIKDSIKWNNDRTANVYGITVAGLPKTAISHFTKYNNPFDEFEDNCIVPEEESHKLLHTYIDEPYKAVITDYLGNESEINSFSGTYLEPMEFSMSMSSDFVNYMLGIKSGVKEFGDYVY